LINSAMDNFRRSNLTLIQGGSASGQSWRMVQISISGLDVWRRAIISHECSMEDLHQLIQIGMDWKNTGRFRFYCETPEGGKEYLHDKIKLADIDFRGKKELIYEYDSKWNVKIIIMSSYQPAKNEVTRFVAGDGAAPPEQVDGPRHFRRLLGFLEAGSNKDKQSAQSELGLEFVPGIFDLDNMNQELRKIFTNE